jgi:tetraacyldisaccharide 4'-kinase
LQPGLKFLLFPFALLYGLVTFIRNKLYDLGILKSHEIAVKSICIGNLSAGGTGKTPYVLLIANHYSEKKIGILSRGYGRKTKGFILVNDNHNSSDVGDEPLLFRKQLKTNCIVAVCENRHLGITEMLKLHPDIELIILDDAFQHRRILAGYSIVLSEFNKPFFKDFILPVGFLREWKCGLKRADVLVYTKCPEKFGTLDRSVYIKKANNYVKRIHFSSISYKTLTPVNYSVQNIKNVLLVSGIANPNPLIAYLEKKYHIELMLFPDHHVFNETDLKEIHQKFDTFALDDKIILTTEKDVVRLDNYLQTSRGKTYPWHTIPITISILEENDFFNELDDYVGKI